MKLQLSILALLFALLVAYPLSLGLMICLGATPVWFHSGGTQLISLHYGNRNIEGFYGPLLWLGDRIPAINHATNWIMFESMTYTDPPVPEEFFRK
jgi:hypothetical protein